MEFTKIQLNTLICNFLKHRENGLNELLQMVLNAIMKLEQSEYLGLRNGINKANGYRPGRVYGHGKLLELRIPRDRNGQFYPIILTLLHHALATLTYSTKVTLIGFNFTGKADHVQDKMFRNKFTQFVIEQGDGVTIQIKHFSCCMRRHTTNKITKKFLLYWNG